MVVVVADASQDMFQLKMGSKHSGQRRAEAYRLKGIVDFSFTRGPTQIRVSCKMLARALSLTVEVVRQPLFAPRVGCRSQTTNRRLTTENGTMLASGGSIKRCVSLQIPHRHTFIVLSSSCVLFRYIVSTCIPSAPPSPLSTAPSSLFPRPGSAAGPHPRHPS